VLKEGEDPASNALTLCSATLTTNGNATIVIIGGNCAECAQPPFHADTVVAIGGVVVASETIAGGTRIVTRTPSIVELAAFEFGYYGLNITTPAGEHGVRSGTVEVGKDAPRAASSADELACAVSAHCPDVAPAESGVYYTVQCQGFLDFDDPRWNVTESAALFAYGIPPNCRACPTGCRCPGGDRCSVVEPGYFLPPGVEVLEGAYSDGPLVCHPGPSCAFAVLPPI
jgi:hypothetical protein